MVTELKSFMLRHSFEVRKVVHLDLVGVDIFALVSSIFASDFDKHRSLARSRFFRQKLSALLLGEILVEDQICLNLYTVEVLLDGLCMRRVIL